MRPISLLSTAFKVREYLIYDKLIGFLSKSLCPSQFGLLSKYFTVLQLLIMLDSIVPAFECVTYCIYMGFKDDVRQNAT